MSFKKIAWIINVQGGHQGALSVLTLRQRGPRIQSHLGDTCNHSFILCLCLSSSEGSEWWAMSDLQQDKDQKRARIEKRRQNGIVDSHIYLIHNGILRLNVKLMQCKAKYYAEHYWIPPGRGLSKLRPQAEASSSGMEQKMKGSQTRAENEREALRWSFTELPDFEALLKETQIQSPIQAKLAAQTKTKGRLKQKQADKRSQWPSSQTTETSHRDLTSRPPKIVSISRLCLHIT